MAAFVGHISAIYTAAADPSGSMCEFAKPGAVEVSEAAHAVRATVSTAYRRRPLRVPGLTRFLCLCIVPSPSCSFVEFSVCPF
jgi:hypothetical protein